MQFKEYFERFPSEEVYCKRNVENEGMLEFTKDTADWWAGPFNEVYAYYCIDVETNNLRSVDTLRGIYLHGHYFYPSRFNLTINSEIKPHILIPKLTDKELKYFQDLIDKCCNTFCVETPWRLYLCGNDDCSYSKFYATKELALEELSLLEACQPLDFFKDIQQNGFVFTN